MAGQFNVVDFVTENHGSVVHFIPQTADAESIMQEMGLESWQMWGKGFVVDWRQAGHMVEALLDTGYSVK